MRSIDDVPVFEWVTSLYVFGHGFPLLDFVGFWVNGWKRLYLSDGCFEGLSLWVTCASLKRVRTFYACEVAEMIPEAAFYERFPNLNTLYVPRSVSQTISDHRSIFDPPLYQRESRKRAITNPQQIALCKFAESMPRTLYSDSLTDIDSTSNCQVQMAQLCCGPVRSLHCERNPMF